MNKIRWSVAIIGIAAAGVLGWLWQEQTRANLELHRENLRLKQQIELLAGQEQEQLRRAKLEAQVEGTNSSQQLLDLLRLRNEVALLRRRTNELHESVVELQHLRASNAGTVDPALPTVGSSNQPVAVWPKDRWGAMGYDTPEHAFQSLNWAALNGDIQAIRAAVTAEMAKALDQQLAESGETNLIHKVRDEFGAKAEVRIVSKTEAAANLVILEVDDRKEGEATFGSRDKLVFWRVDGLWKLAEEN